MNKVLNRVAAATDDEATTGKPSETTKYITFKLANYLFALPSQKILKIVATPPPSQGGMVSMGLVQLEQYSIQILDLINLLGLNKAAAKATSEMIGSPAAKLGGLLKKDESSDENPPFLMVLQNADRDLFGIAVDEPPDLMDIPSYALKSVPPEKRMTRTLRWISHVVTFDLGSNRHTLLLLDLDAILEFRQPETNPENIDSLAIEPPIESESEKARQEEMYA
ncbi:MAG: chemotaxis protein CheW [Phormidesmis sp.]